MIKRLGILVLACSIILAILPVFSVSADNVEAWVILDYRFGNPTADGSIVWSSRYSMELGNGNYQYDGSFKYIKIDRVRVLNTTNKPSDIFISFTVSVHPFVYSNVTSQSVFDGTNARDWTSSRSDFTGYFKSRSSEFKVEPLNDTLFGPGRTCFCVGQYHIDDVNDTAFTLTPNSDIYFGYSYSSGSGVCIQINNVNVCFVGNDSQLYDLNSNLINIYDWFLVCVISVQIFTNLLYQLFIN